jgi:hypothetical protein
MATPRGHKRTNVRPHHDLRPTTRGSKCDARLGPPHRIHCKAVALDRIIEIQAYRPLSNACWTVTVEQGLDGEFYAFS